MNTTTECRHSLEQSTPITTALKFSVVTPLRQWVESFLRAKAAEQVSKNTIHFYGANLKVFLAWSEGQGIQRLEDITPDALRNFMLWLKDTGHNVGGIHGFYRTLRTLFRWYLVEVEPENWRCPTERVKAPKLVDEPLEAVSLSDVEVLYRSASGKMAARDRAILLVLADSGLRASELTSLDLQDVDVWSGSISVRCGKGGKSRTVFIGQRTRRALRLWLKQRSNVGSALFTSNEGTRLRYFGLRQVVKRLSAKASIKPPSLHSFRRCFAINFLRNNGDLLSLSRLLGHAGLSLLSRYASQSTDDLAIQHASHSPIDRL
jgi:integrase/recombinase XerD